MIPVSEWVEAFPTDDEIYQSEAYQRWLMEQELAEFEFV